MKGANLAAAPERLPDTLTAIDGPDLHNFHLERIVAGGFDVTTLVFAHTAYDSSTGVLLYLHLYEPGLVSCEFQCEQGFPGTRSIEIGTRGARSRDEQP